MARRPTLEFLRTESGAGLILAAAAAAAVAAANSPLAGDYFAFLAHPVRLQLGAFVEVRTIASWVKDGLMAVFFLVLGMEIKFEVLRGELSGPRRLALPLIAAIGGVVAPALVYLAINRGAAGTPAAWPTPTVTDIAFALAVLAIVAPRMPSALRVFLLTLAIADDLSAVGLITLLFHQAVHAAALGGALLALLALIALSRWRRAPFLFYAVGFLVVWALTLKSGLNTSIAGVACSLTVPVGPRRPGQDSVLKFFMDSLHPYVAFAILPLFAFTAAGFSFAQVRIGSLASALPLGVALALLVGKPLGVFGSASLAIAFRLTRRPAGTTWLELGGVAILCGVGFTLSLFVGALAVSPANPLAQDQVRLGVFAGSLAAALVGGGALFVAQQARTARGEDRRE